MSRENDCENNPITALDGLISTHSQLIKNHTSEVNELRQIFEDVIGTRTVADAYKKYEAAQLKSIQKSLEIAMSANLKLHSASEALTQLTAEISRLKNAEPPTPRPF